ncbi:Myb-like DNA-binding domain containing protein [Tritrichomonas foetus]|uniref:Myb-like DNA-binding domain containing protein n=1 Tax=Tritrichomonas foetus TaxID=1144522 RepID=A0A1J4JDV5_9EUKA|nr:Myb-like DNA-binding domain containing protein [Tritrichomonas foetus]|eukprot:OHS95436.1 Myb-like DNA-binding domain containing protein [Tritrichomonas foetus]
MYTKTQRRKPFTHDEDTKLIDLVKEYGDKENWDVISKEMKKRDRRQCRDRWRYYLSPDNNIDKWTREEDKLLLKLVGEDGRKWATFKHCFPGRTAVNVKNRWYHLNRQQQQIEQKSHPSKFSQLIKHQIDFKDEEANIPAHKIVSTDINIDFAFDIEAFEEYLKNSDNEHSITIEALYLSDEYFEI